MLRLLAVLLLSGCVVAEPVPARRGVVGELVSLGPTPFLAGASSGLRVPGGPWDGQPVQGFSGLTLDADGGLLAVTDNGFGALVNSDDFYPRVFRLEVADGALHATPLFRFADAQGPLTGADVDPESLVRAADGTFWVGEEFGPSLLHVDARGQVLGRFRVPEEDGGLLRSPDAPELARMVRTLLAVQRRVGVGVASPNHLLLESADSVEQLHRAGFRVVPWTVNEPARMRELAAWGVDGLITDRPDLAPPPLQRVQGHRGARGLRPESTLPGFELALELGVGTLELDLTLISDGGAIIWHDPSLEAPKCFPAEAQRAEDSGTQMPRASGERGPPAPDTDVPSRTTSAMTPRSAEPSRETASSVNAATSPQASRAAGLSRETTSTDAAPRSAEPSRETASTGSVNATSPPTVFATSSAPRSAEPSRETASTGSVNAKSSAPRSAMTSARGLPSPQPSFPPNVVAPGGFAQGERGLRLVTASLEEVRRWRCDGLLPERFPAQRREVGPLTTQFVVAGRVPHAFAPLTLRDLLDFLEFRARRLPGAPLPRLNIETKGHRPGEATRLRQHLLDTVVGTPWESRVTLQSFDFSSLARGPLPTIALVDGAPSGARAQVPRSGGFEGLAASIDGGTLYALLEKPLPEDGAHELRAYAFDPVEQAFTGLAFRFPLDPRAVAVGDLTMLSASAGLALERDDSEGKADGYNRLIGFELPARAGEAVRRFEVADLLRVPARDGGTLSFPFWTIEGLTRLPDGRVAIIADDNFPFGRARHPDSGVPDETELLLLELP